MDWQEDILMGGFALIVVFLVYVVVRMLINRLKGRDEIQGLFVIRFKKNKNKP